MAGTKTVSGARPIHLTNNQLHLQASQLKKNQLIYWRLDGS